MCVCVCVCVRVNTDRSSPCSFRRKNGAPLQVYYVSYPDNDGKDTIVSCSKRSTQLSLALIGGGYPLPRTPSERRHMRRTQEHPGIRCTLVVAQFVFVIFLVQNIAWGLRFILA